MGSRLVRGLAGLLVVASGALMWAASAQRWGDACPWGAPETGPCELRQDHLYDFVVPTAPWEPVGDAAQLAGSSLLVLALALPLMSWAMAGRRPDLASAAATGVYSLAVVDVGLATLRSGLAGEVVPPTARALAVLVWGLLSPIVLARLAVGAGAWGIAGVFWMILGTPLVAAFTYAVGPYDAQPWWEAIAGALTATGGLCVLLDAVLRGRFRRSPTTGQPLDPPAAVRTAPPPSPRRA